MSKFEEIVETYTFRPGDLAPARRQPGISAFMRIRNGAAFLETTIRSHIAHFDEIVAVYNQCTDATPSILARLAREYEGKLRVFHYLPEVYPPGSDGHASEPANSPRSLVNYYNFSLTRTRFAVATKLDDDHLAMSSELARLTQRVRAGAFGSNTMACFSGLNLARDPTGRIGIPAHDPFSGSGDIGFFPVTATTCFVHDRRFERFNRGGLKRRFAGIVYWHLKYLKPEFGFSNYEIEANPTSRYARKLATLTASGTVLSAPELVARARHLPGWLQRLPFPEKPRLVRDRWRALRGEPPSEAALRAALATAGITTNAD